MFQCFCDWSVLFGCSTVIGEPPEQPALHHGLHGLPLQVGETGRVTESLGKGVAVDLQLGNLHTGYILLLLQKKLLIKRKEDLLLRNVQ